MSLVKARSFSASNAPVRTPYVPFRAIFVIQCVKESVGMDSITVLMKMCRCRYLLDKYHPREQGPPRDLFTVSGPDQMPFQESQVIGCQAAFANMHHGESP